MIRRLSFNGIPGRSKGMLLPMTLVIITLCSLLTLSLLQSIWLWTKSNQQISQQQAAVYALEAGLYQLASQPIVLACLRPAQTDIFRQRPNDCRFSQGEKHYRYFWEDLGRYDCLQVKIRAKVKSSRFYRLNLYAIGSRRAIQALMIKPDTGYRCVNEARVIQSGLQGWQWVEVK